MPYIELSGASRGYSITTDSITQTFVYKICNENLDRVGYADSDWGIFFTPNDDVSLAQYVYATFPVFRAFPIDAAGTPIILYLTEHNAVHLVDDVWQVTLTYSLPPQDESDYVQFGIDIGGETIHISQSLGVRYSSARTGLGLTPPDVRNCIGLTKNSIEGADVIAKGLNFNITRYINQATWSTGLLPTLYVLQGNYNNGTFYGFAAGEVLFLSASAQGSQYGLISMTLNFSAKPNANGIADPPFPNLYALGHDIIDYLYTKDVDSQYPVQAPVFRYVHQVGYPVNFDLLGV